MPTSYPSDAWLAGLCCGAAGGAMLTLALQGNSSCWGTGHHHLAVATATRQLASSGAAGDEAGPPPPPLPDGQLDPTSYEEAGTDDRLARRIETVLRRRTARVTVVLERLCDGHNYAAVLRTCEAAGIQNVFLIAPPPIQERYESATMKKRKDALAAAARDVEKESHRRAGVDVAPQPSSRRQTKRDKRETAAANVWQADVALDTQHASYGKNAARFLKIQRRNGVAGITEFATSELALQALREEGCTVWATDLSQGAVVLAAGASWLGETPEALPQKLAIVIGTESTGVSRFILDNCDRRVYLPQNGFADSLNASVAAALCIHTLLDLYGNLACGDLAREAQPSELDQLRREWAEHLSRGPEQMQRMLDLLSSGALNPYDDLRRPDTYRAHCGKLTKFERRRAHKQREAERIAAKD